MHCIRASGSATACLQECNARLGNVAPRFDQRTPEKLFEGYWAVCKIVRKRVFCDEMQQKEEDEFDDLDESSRHIIVQGEQ